MPTNGSGGDTNKMELKYELDLRGFIPRKKKTKHNSLNLINDCVFFGCKKCEFWTFPFANAKCWGSTKKKVQNSRSKNKIDIIIDLIID